jgi:hypothetical protein
MFEVVIINRRPFRWEWQLCDREGKVILGGLEKSRAAAKYAGERALFLLLLNRPDIDPSEASSGP